LAGALAERIVNEYGGVLEQAVRLYLGAPESLLPRGKKEIEAAIVEYAVHLHSRSALDEETYANLRIAYAELAHFLSDEDARSAAMAWGALSSKDLDRFTVDVETAMSESQRMMDRKLRRRFEFDSVMVEAGVRGAPESGR